MLERVGSLWNEHDAKHWIVVPTNIGWRKDEANPMGAGVARTAAEKFPDLPGWYGRRCKRYGAETAVSVYEDGLFFLFPTKPLNEARPWLSWQNEASLDLIDRSAYQLAHLVDHLTEENKFFGDIFLPMVGCGAGGLAPSVVVPVLRHYLDDRFVLLEVR